MAIRSLKTGAMSRSALAGNPVIMPGSFESIATVSGNGSSSSFTFSSIPATYSHLQIRLISRGTRAFASEQLYIRLNGDAASNYAYHYVYGDGSGAAAGLRCQPGARARACAARPDPGLAGPAPGVATPGTAPATGRCPPESPLAALSQPGAARGSTPAIPGPPGGAAPD